MDNLDARKENKKENFKRISENRVSKILTLLNQLTNLTNTSFYDYTDEDIEKIFDAIDEASKNSKEVLLRANNKDKKNKRFVLWYIQFLPTMSVKR